MGTWFQIVHTQICLFRAYLEMILFAFEFFFFFFFTLQNLAIFYLTSPTQYLKAGDTFPLTYHSRREKVQNLSPK